MLWNVRAQQLHQSVGLKAPAATRPSLVAGRKPQAVVIRRYKAKVKVDRLFEIATNPAEQNIEDAEELVVEEADDEDAAEVVIEEADRSPATNTEVGLRTSVCAHGGHDLNALLCWFLHISRGTLPEQQASLLLQWINIKTCLSVAEVWPEQLRHSLAGAIENFRRGYQALCNELGFKVAPNFNRLLSFPDHITFGGPPRASNTRSYEQQHKIWRQEWRYTNPHKKELQILRNVMEVTTLTSDVWVEKLGYPTYLYPAAQARITAPKLQTIEKPATMKLTATQSEDIGFGKSKAPPPAQIRPLLEEYLQEIWKVSDDQLEDLLVPPTFASLNGVHFDGAILKRGALLVVEWVGPRPSTRTSPNPCFVRCEHFYRTALPQSTKSAPQYVTFVFGSIYNVASGLSRPANLFKASEPEVP
ncbi:MAG TPA: hypothetical protein V6D20_02655, partial [Candidatus Obscuribacterales bacterium]